MSTKIRQFIQVFSGTSLIGIGISLNYLANLGLGPWGVFHDGLSKTLGISYGRTIIIIQVLLRLFMGLSVDDPFSIIEKRLKKDLVEV